MPFFSRRWGNVVASTGTLAETYSDYYNNIYQPTWTTQGLTSATTDALVASRQEAMAYYANWATQTFTVPFTSVETGATTTSALSQIFWVEEDLQTAQYLALARQRVGTTLTRQTEIARIRASELRQTEELRREAMLRAEQRRRDYDLALVRSKELLLAHLTPRQRKTFEENNWFVVHGGRTQTKYRIRCGLITGNIEVYEGDHVTHRLCGHLSHDIPHFDHILAQKVSLELDEDAFVRICNRHAV